MTEQTMKWKVAITGTTGNVYRDTNANRLLFPFPIEKEAEAHAQRLRASFAKTENQVQI
jgi:hypothetical protein